MTLTDIWSSSRSQVENKSIQQIIAFAGGGKLRDGNDTSDEFRKYLTLIPSVLLKQYIDQCLNQKFDDSGLVLQDLVNEIGERLGFQVNYGRYRGTQNALGFDGLWTYPTGHNLIIEIKTTDAYRIDLEKLADYREGLVDQAKVKYENCSILIVVGREDTGGLEAQIRGSKHAWDIRVVSCDALLRLLDVKEAVDDPETIQRIHQVLIPREFTKLDEIIALIFSAAQDVKNIDTSLELLESELQEVTHRTGATPVSFNDECVARIETKLKQNFVKRSYAQFSTPDKKIGIVCAVSKAHGSDANKYWYGFHPYHKDFLSEVETAYVAFGCGSPSNILLIPFSDFDAWLDGMNQTVKDDRYYWHVHITKDIKRYILVRKQGEEPKDLTKYYLVDS